MLLGLYQNSVVASQQHHLTRCSDAYDFLYSKNKLSLFGRVMLIILWSTRSYLIIFHLLNQVKPALVALRHLIYSTDEEVLTDACWALSYLSDGTNDKIQAVIEAGVCPRLVELLL